MKRLALVLVVLGACSGEDVFTFNEEEVITTMVLTFTPPAGAPVVVEFDDPDGDGGQSPTTDPIALSAGNYTLSVGFENRLSSPPEEITDEIRDEQDFHLLLFTGDAPLAQTYADQDDNGLPVGLTNSVVASPGAGKLTVTLRHMPPEEPPQKASDTLDMAKSGGVDSIGGSTDAQVNFMVTVQ
jgi:hypothetical protein